MFKYIATLLFLTGISWAGTYPGQDLMIGAPFTLSGGMITPPMSTVKSSSTLTVVGTTTVAIPNLAINLQANTTYQFEYYLLFQTTTTTTGARFNMKFSATPTVVAYNVQIPIAADGTAAAFNGWGTANADQVIGTSVQTVNVSFMTHIRGIVVTSSASSMSPEIACELGGINQVKAMPNSLGIITVIP